MAVKFGWTCPYCNRDATITESNYSESHHIFDENNKVGELGIITKVITCPNEECREFTIAGSLHKTYYNRYRYLEDEALISWSLKPQSNAKQFPSYIPEAIIGDYDEACLIRELSPKASATLSRRCLQGIIRDFWGVKKGRLVDEINAIKDKVDPITWQAIDAVRNIGNIGAHMEKDINLIIDVEPQEAQLLTGLIEILIKDWYVTRQERQIHLESIIGVAGQKAEAKKKNQAVSN
ncbi:TPA: DUF4145 domain-containing protein [Vibrio vulnificus]|uniref:DUF4145 domain-containing protein n=1 Tax=Vibrio TaxID=662 RepID=UPI00111E6B4F|nr:MULTISPECIES: DUF4145 domain-containing protein [Vibrio]EHU5198915.1 DUF4145 domain-containing protein [Vibrio vulnificus]EIJ6616445.1 DUF4145 domain-containing protein [Vibrio parahaemolyticus]EIO3979907.1 DUF4145 domain-containing protein [Vibrio vulnificus]MCU8124753.1 DUF4145 domain-containing protein [Vibrio vulnificus]MCU8203380.1 DUF4145 domain-containing protein [Vibrio vulnificus]